MSTYLVDPGVAASEFPPSRYGHWYRSTVIGFPGYVTWQLINYDAAKKTVLINVNGMTTYQNLQDLGGLQYLGPVKPQEPGTPGTPGGAPGGGVPGGGVPGGGTPGGIPYFCLQNPWNPACFIYYTGAMGGGIGGQPGIQHGGYPGAMGQQRGYIAWVPYYVAY